MTARCVIVIQERITVARVTCNTNRFCRYSVAFCGKDQFRLKAVHTVHQAQINY